MKIKKTLSILVLVASLLTLSQSAFAADTTTSNNVSVDQVTPLVIGIGDTRDNALTLLAPQTYNLYLENSNDEDWYKWTNNTGEGKFILGTVYNKGNNNSITLGAQIVYSGGSRESTLLYADPTPVGNQQYPSIIRNLYIPEGASLYFKIKTNTFVSIEQYQFSFNVF